MARSGSLTSYRFPSAEFFPQGVTLQAIDGGATYYASNGFTYAANAGWDDPNYFPIGAWLAPIDSDADGDRLNDLGINTIAGIGPSFMDANTFARIASHDLNLLAYDNDIAAADLPNNAAYWIANVLLDEATTFADISASISTIANAKQDNRWWWYNGNWFFFETIATFGGGLTPHEASAALATTVATPNATLRHIDLASTDCYWFAGAKVTSPNFVLGAGGNLYNLAGAMTLDQAARACRYGDLVDFMRATQTTYPAPIGQFIENGGPYAENTTGASYITPAEMNAAVWSSIMHGARWICYFNHSFGGPAATPDISTDNFGLSYFQTIQSGETISIYDQAKATNALIAQLATVINSPTVTGFATVSPPAVVISASVAYSGFDLMVKYNNRGIAPDNRFYIFAMPRYSRTTTNQTATFTIANTGATRVIAVNEGRAIPITGGGTTFTDNFATGNTVHIYRVG